jgi:hypothetical protein
MQATKVHREVLYKEVWEDPISKLAIRYNISDVALAKVCRKLHVPVPPRGYWARIQHGQHVTRPKLPKLPIGAIEDTTISPVLVRSRILPDAVVKQKEFEVDPAHRISIDLNRELHPLVRKARAVLNGKSTPSDKDLPIDVHVGKSSRERALCLLSTMLYAFEERRFKVEACSGTNNGSFVIINDEPLRFSLNEETKKTDVRLATNTEHSSDAERVAETRLVFRIHSYRAQGYRKMWADGARRMLESQLNDMMPALVELSAVIRKERLECERRNAEIHEEFRQRDLERARRQQMESDLKNWRIAVDLRTLVAQVSSQASDEQKNTPDVTRWIKWANWVASVNDPLQKGVAPFVERYKF